MFETEKSKGRNRVEKIIIPWTTSFALPDAGGMLDQKYRLMIFFGSFMSGDRKAAMKRLNSSS